MITKDNWHYVYYIHQKIKASLFLGALPDHDGNLYSLTLYDNDYKELFQKDFFKFNHAAREINTKYSHWTFIDPLAADQASCTSCAAHP